MKMFNYLNQKQISDMMLLFCLGDKIEEIINTWVQYENMTKEEAKKKKANRFDEDDEIIEYNFTPKLDK